MATTMRVAETPARSGARPPMLDAAIDGPIAWRRDDLRPAEWQVRPNPAVRDEVDALARRFADFSGDHDALRLDALSAPATQELMLAIRACLTEGRGFAVLDRLPVEGWTEAGARAVSWLLGNAVAPAVRQKWNSPSRMYDVRDTGMRHGYGVRRSLTNLKQDLHTDGPWLGATADFMGLACIRQAEDGGTSSLASLASVHNRLRATHPELLARLYRPFHWDRQAEHATDDTPASALPIYTWNGRALRARYYDDYVRSGHRLTRTPLDPEGAAALDAMRAILEEPEMSFVFRLTPGQMLFANNHLVAHGRGAFVDRGSTPGGRLLLRFWLRPEGGVGFEAEAPKG